MKCMRDITFGFLVISVIRERYTSVCRAGIALKEEQESCKLPRVMPKVCSTNSRRIVLRKKRFEVAGTVDDVHMVVGAGVPCRE